MQISKQVFTILQWKQKVEKSWPALIFQNMNLSGV